MNFLLRIRSKVGVTACAWLALMGMLTPCPAAAQSAFPGKAIKIVVPNAAGGAADITARIVGQKLGEALGQPVVIENKPSAGGVVAGEQVARSEPDGHTLLLISSGTAVSASLFKVLPFDRAAAREYAKVCVLVRQHGRTHRRRAVDLMIAATASAHAVPLITANAEDLRGAEALVEIIAVNAS